MEITKPMDYLKCYGHKYRTAKIPELEKINGETLKFKLRNEQEVVLRTKHKSPTDFEPNFFHIWLLDDENLVASLPPNSASILLKRFPEYFEKRYSFKDMVELKFKETNLDKVAEPLKIRYKNHYSNETLLKVREKIRTTKPHLKRKLYQSTIAESYKID